MLSFYDHDRQTYGTLPIEAAAEFMVGDYGSTDDHDHGVGSLGEFKIELVKLGSGGGRAGLYPRLRVFGEAGGALRVAIDAGLLDAMSCVDQADEFAQRLIALGFEDRSDFPIGSRPAKCPCCAQPNVRRAAPGIGIEREGR